MYATLVSSLCKDDLVNGLPPRSRPLRVVQRLFDPASSFEFLDHRDQGLVFQVQIEDGPDALTLRPH